MRQFVSMVLRYIKTEILKGEEVIPIIYTTTIHEKDGSSIEEYFDGDVKDIIEILKLDGRELKFDNDEEYNISFTQGELNIVISGLFLALDGEEISDNGRRWLQNVHDKLVKIRRN